ncbi:carbonic anhydrase-like [Onthophagus taurus]|uniref:carbonic anhydrase-like n=1 Tax=Onthophagus taurus TaxID=166361 RepID=UPI000C1FF05E|nr:carbonic anhydrase-like [Onthophagus taurus]
MNLFMSVVILLILFQLGFGQDFGYEGTEGPSHWGERYHQCAGKHQSPINIEEHNVELVTLLPIIYKNFDIPPERTTLTNNGHTVVLNISTTEKPTITGGPLIGHYEFAQLHFHWGSNDEEGSENTINNSSFPMEMHMVFFSSSYGSMSEAVYHPDGVCVLAFLFSKSDEINRLYSPLIEALPHVNDVDTKIEMENLPGFDDLLINNRSTYFTYSGSLTTPPCSEVVTWIEYRSTIPLAHSQLEEFRKLNSPHGKLSHNFRPTQPLHGRAIRMNYDIYHVNEEKNSHDKICFDLVLLILCSFLQFLF